MILKRNISTFAAVLALMAFMLLSASPAKAFKTTNPDMAEAYDECLTNKYQGKAKNVKKCFEDFRTTYAETCLAENQTVDGTGRQIDNVIDELHWHVGAFNTVDALNDISTQGRGRREKMNDLLEAVRDSRGACAHGGVRWEHIQ